MLHSLSFEERREYQFYRLQHLLQYARREIPYWRQNIGKDLTISSTFNIKDFERMPILTREKLIKYERECVVRNIQRRRFRAFVTSGSTGIPKKFVGKKVYFQKMMAIEEFYVSFCGVKDFKQHGYLLHKPHLADLVTYIQNGLTDDALQRLLKDKSILSVGGSLNRLLSLAEKVESGKIQFKPKFVLSGSEFLAVENRKYLEKVFQCPLYNKYVCAEAGIIGFECPELGGFHMDHVHCYVEIVDDNDSPIENGTQGRIIITTFNNLLMPLIRYDIGDIGMWVEGDCTCGLNTPRLFFEGRKLDYVEFMDGRKFSAIGLMRSIDTKFANIIAKQQIVQESLSKILFKFVPGPDYRPFYDELICNFIHHILRNFPKISVEIMMVQSLDNFKNGKHVIFESHVKT